jgi:UDP-N-acetylglucosamine--N-acetylmuramyl-(pentapeptide) pyrophosphoryl-undecaprenol N-acetylglucosamine transferase
MVKELPVAHLPNVHLLPFVDRVDLAYAAADLVVARAGALTISELCVVGVPSILVPSPNVAEDHQTKNALALTQLSAARLVRDADAPEKLMQEALIVLNNDALSFSLSENIRPLGKPNAARNIADEALRLITRNL